MIKCEKELRILNVIVSCTKRKHQKERLECLCGSEETNIVITEGEINNE